MMKNNIRNIILIPAFAAVLTACSIDESQMTIVDEDVKVSQVAHDALPGQLFVRFDASVSRVLEQAGVTKSGIEAPARRSGVLSVDEILRNKLLRMTEFYSAQSRTLSS